MPLLLQEVFGDNFFLISKSEKKFRSRDLNSVNFPSLSKETFDFNEMVEETSCLPTPASLSLLRDESEALQWRDETVDVQNAG